jgi:hypothetical protein
VYWFVYRRPGRAGPGHVSPGAGLLNGERVHRPPLVAPGGHGH